MKAAVLTFQIVLITQVVTAQPNQDIFPLRSKEHGKGAVYAFVDERSCFICSKQLVFLHKLALEQAIPFIVFILGADAERASKMAGRELNGITEYVHDEFYVYNRVFNIAELPMLLVLDKSGRMLYRGVPGKAAFDLDQYNKGLQNVKTSMYDQFRYPLRGIDHVNVTKVIKLPDSLTVSTSIALSGAYCQSTNDYVLLNHHSKEMFLVNSMGETTILPNIPAYKLPFTSSTPLIKGRSTDGKSVVLWDTDIQSAKPFIVLLNFAYTSFSQEILPSDTDRLNRRFEFMGDSLPFIIPKRIGDGYEDYLPDSTLLFIGRNLRWHSIGRRDSIFYDSTMCNYAWLTTGSYDDRVLVYQNMTDHIDEYDTLGTLISRLQLEIPGDLLEQLNLAFPALGEIALQSKYSHAFDFKVLANNLLVDTKTRIGCLTLAYRVESLKNPPSGSDHGEYQCIAIFIDLAKMKQLQITQFPIGFSPIRMANGIIHGLFVDKGTISIVNLEEFAPKR